MNTQCPVCDAAISLPAGTEESEIITCAECQSRVVVESISSGKALLAIAPTVEEDWGE